MTAPVPASLKVEHEQLHAELDRATREPGALGEAACELARLLHPHFVKEERYAMPALTLLPKLAWGAEALMLHAQTEEEVLYPAAEIVGEYVELKLREARSASRQIRSTDA